MLQNLFQPIFLEPISNFPKLQDLSEVAYKRCQNNIIFKQQEQLAASNNDEEPSSASEPLLTVSLLSTPDPSKYAVMLAWAELQTKQPNLLHPDKQFVYHGPVKQHQQKLAQFYDKLDPDYLISQLKSGLLFCELLKAHNYNITSSKANNNQSALNNFRSCLNILQKIKLNDFKPESLALGENLFDFLEFFHTLFSKQKPINSTNITTIKTQTDLSINQDLITFLNEIQANLDEFLHQNSKTINLQLKILQMEPEFDQQLISDRWRNGVFFKNFFNLILKEPVKQKQTAQKTLLQLKNELVILFERASVAFKYKLPDAEQIMRGNLQQIYFAITVFMAVYYQQQLKTKEFMEMFSMQSINLQYEQELKQMTEIELITKPTLQCFENEYLHALQKIIRIIALNKQIDVKFNSKNNTMNTDEIKAALAHVNIKGFDEKFNLKQQIEFISQLIQQFKLHFKINVQIKDYDDFTVQNAIHKQIIQPKQTISCEQNWDELLQQLF
ncbi:Calponin_homology domain [Hexamita inflata]|uniref:Calponin_homology domain n=1 Tax=Hexamita inflata TaxID=28002 RepID=A0ABP1HDQ8_9EUKA